MINRAGVAKSLQLLASSPDLDAVVLVSLLAGPRTREGEEADIRRVVESTT